MAGLWKNPLERFASDSRPKKAISVPISSYSTEIAQRSGKKASYTVSSACVIIWKQAISDKKMPGIKPGIFLLTEQLLQNRFQRLADFSWIAGNLDTAFFHN